MTNSFEFEPVFNYLGVEHEFKLWQIYDDVCLVYIVQRKKKLSVDIVSFSFFETFPSIKIY